MAISAWHPKRSTLPGATGIGGAVQGQHSVGTGQTNRCQLMAAGLTDGQLVAPPTEDQEGPPTALPPRRGPSASSMCPAACGWTPLARPPPACSLALAGRPPQATTVCPAWRTSGHLAFAVQGSCVIPATSRGDSDTRLYSIPAQQPCPHPPCQLPFRILFCSQQLWGQLAGNLRIQLRTSPGNT
jgi:hypothetical protein